VVEPGFGGSIEGQRVGMGAASLVQRPDGQLARDGAEPTSLRAEGASGSKARRRPR
jgi:hypothetical protein